MHRVARDCEFPLSKPFSLLSFASRCTVLRSRWCQGGVRYHPGIHITLSCASSSFESKSGKVCLMRLTGEPPPPGPIQTSTGGTLEGQAKGAPLACLVALDRRLALGQM
jgi:hypothetical protein